AECASNCPHNGEAGPAGQPARKAFPKGFKGISEGFQCVSGEWSVELDRFRPPRLALQQWLDHLFEGFERGLALHHGSV
ncbi:hypothetical protein QIG13_27920, partial [Klebsiella pneumoniae]|nr:hypothetical protein [Klebsiella pneumoniae]